MRSFPNIIESSFNAASELHRQYTRLLEFANSVDGELDIEVDGDKPGKYNIVKSQVNQIVNPLEETPPEATVYPGDGAVNSDAQVVSGYLRHVQVECDAGQIYMDAFRNMVAGGLGCWIYRMADPDDAGFDDINDDIGADDTKKELEIVAEWLDPRQVAWDPSSRKPGKKDARWCVIKHKQNRDDFYETYDKAKKLVGEATDDVQLDTPEDDIEFYEVWLRNTKERRIERHIVYNNVVVLEDLTYKGGVIPVVWLQAPTQHISEGKEIVQPISLFLYDVQNEINYWRTTMTNLIAKAPKSIWMAERGSIHADNEKAYQESAFDPDVILYYEPGHNKPEPIAAPEIPESYLKLCESNIALARDITALYPQASQYMQQGMDAPSGAGVKQMRSESGIAGHEYHAIFKRAMHRAGKIMFNLVMRYQNNDTVRVSLGADGNVRQVSLGPKRIERPGLVNIDLEAAKYGVIVQSGPSYASQKQELLERLTEFASKDPQVYHLIADYLISQWGIPGTEELAKRFQIALLPPQVQQMIASEQSADPVQQVQSLTMQLLQQKQTSQQMQQVLTTITKELAAMRQAYTELKQDRSIELQKAQISAETTRAVNTDTNNTRVQLQQMGDTTKTKLAGVDVQRDITLQNMEDRSKDQLQQQGAAYDLLHEQMISDREENDTAAEQRLHQ